MTRPLHIYKRLHGQRGGASIWFALLLPMLLGFAALAIDLARLHLIKVELQNAADAGALAGARSLTDPSGEQPYSWTVAENTAGNVAKHNYANGALIQDANMSVNSGYWNIKNSSYNQSHTSTGTGDVPAVHVTVSLTGLKLFFGPIFRLFDPDFITERDIQASAIAMIAPPGGGTGIFPFAIGLSVFNNYWDSAKNEPKPGQSIEVSLDSVYPSGGAGTWTSFNITPSSDKVIGGIISSQGNTDPITIGPNGTKIYLASGTKTNLYGNKQYPLPIGQDIAIVVVDDTQTALKNLIGIPQTIYAIAGFHIDSVGGNGNKSYLTGHFIDTSTFSSTNPGTGNGKPYGAVTPPSLVQ